MKNYDVIIINYNGEKIILECLNSLYSCTVLPSKIIIYDNNSKDNSIKLIKEKYPQVILIEGKENLGFGRANNEAMKHSDAEFILFMNNDLILDKDCPKALLEGFKDQNLAILNPMIFRGRDKKKDAEIYSFGAEMNESGFGYSLYDVDTDRTDLSCFSGACFMGRSKIVKKLQFEKSFFLYYEEPALSTQALMSGYKIGRVSDAKCYHLESYSSPKKKADGICFRQYYGIQNRWYMLGKYWPTSLLILAMPLNILHLIYNVFFFIKNGKFHETGVIYLSFSNLYKGRKKFRKSHDNLWTQKLANTKLSSLLDIQKKVYQ